MSLRKYIFVKEILLWFRITIHKHNQTESHTVQNIVSKWLFESIRYLSVIHFNAYLKV